MSVQTTIENKLQAALSADVLMVENESHHHSVPANSETHFKVVAVADAFTGLRPVQRHQLVYRILAEELASDVHALALHTYTAQEWRDKQIAPVSPECAGKG